MKCPVRSGLFNFLVTVIAISAPTQLNYLSFKAAVTFDIKV